MLQALQHSITPTLQLSPLFDRYIALEQQIQQMINLISGKFCAQCSSPCCEECFCKESIESPFLLELVKKQKIAYHVKEGWMSSSGCRLKYGRPLVCYDFFCDAIAGSPTFQATDIQEIVREFLSIGNNALGSTHLVCINDLESISQKKIDKMLRRIESLIEETYNY
jgi:hypothetical protein